MAAFTTNSAVYVNWNDNSVAIFEAESKDYCQSISTGLRDKNN